MFVLTVDNARTTCVLRNRNIPSPASRRLAPEVSQEAGEQEAVTLGWSGAGLPAGGGA
jgi:hypothetical protein